MNNFFKGILFLFSFLLLIGCSKSEPATLDTIPERIISLAPDLTETVYALGLGSNLVGATTYCLYPEAAKEVPRVGGFGQFNFESIVSLNPDLVILHTGYENEKRRLDGLNIPYVQVQTRSMSNILEAIETIGTACGVQPKASEILADINAQLAAHRQKESEEIPVLVTFGGNAGHLDQIHVFGTECLHNELLNMAGGKNVIGERLPFSTLSKEAVIRLNPDIIIQLAPGTEAPADPLGEWKDLSGVNAVKNKRVYVLTGDYTCIPGPRFIQILDDFAEIIHPAHP